MRLIDADALEKEFCSGCQYENNKYSNCIDCALAHAPTIEKRKTGKWENCHTTCSECGWQIIDDVTESPNMVGFNFCPNCGADMRAKKK